MAVRRLESAKSALIASQRIEHGALSIGVGPDFDHKPPRDEFLL